MTPAVRGFDEHGRLRGVLDTLLAFVTQPSSAVPVTANWNTERMPSHREHGKWVRPASAPALWFAGTVRADPVVSAGHRRRRIDASEARRSATCRPWRTSETPT